MVIRLAQALLVFYLFFEKISIKPQLRDVNHVQKEEALHNNHIDKSKKDNFVP